MLKINSIANVIVKNTRFTNKKLETLKIPSNYKINLVAIKRDGKVIIPSRNEILMVNDELLFISANENINAVYNDFSISDSNWKIEHPINKIVKKKRSFWNLFRKKNKNKKGSKKELKKTKKSTSIEKN